MTRQMGPCAQSAAPSPGRPCGEEPPVGSCATGCVPGARVGLLSRVSQVMKLAALSAPLSPGVVSGNVLGHRWQWLWFRWHRRARSSSPGATDPVRARLSQPVGPVGDGARESTLVDRGNTDCRRSHPTHVAYRDLPHRRFAWQPANQQTRTQHRELRLPGSYRMTPYALPSRSRQSPPFLRHYPLDSARRQVADSAATAGGDGERRCTSLAGGPCGHGSGCELRARPSVPSDTRR
jgi:hypothetical protein